MVKSAKFQMTIHIDNDREENKIQFLMASQTKMIRTLVYHRCSIQHHRTSLNALRNPDTSAICPALKMRPLF